MNKVIIVLGHIINPKSDKKCDFIKNGAIALKYKSEKNGLGKYIVEELGRAASLLKSYKQGFQLVDYTDHIIIPSFFDMHFHWVQDDVREMPKENLLSWLENYTFPNEEKFKSKSFAKKKAQAFFPRLLSVGTLGGACFSSIHGHALDYAMENSLGDFIIGNVLMTMNSPKNLTQTKSQAIKIVEKMSKKYKKNYALTPRFAIATGPEVMKETSEIAKKYKCFMQSHLCETQNEIDFVMDIYKEKKGFEKIKSYTEIYQKVGMLGNRSIMGHGIHLQKTELEVLSKTKTSIAHCPTSNAPVGDSGLGSGLFNFKQVEKYNIPWALGSDIGGGPVLSMFDVMRSFVEQNKEAGRTGATYKKALYRATLAGAELLKIQKKKGNLDISKEANFIVLPKRELSPRETVESLMSSLMAENAGERIKFDHLIEKVVYQGRLVYAKESY